MIQKKSPPSEIDIHVGKKLRDRRQLIGMSQDDLGKIVGVTFQQIQKYEKGDNRIGASRLYKIAAALNVDIAFFFENVPSQGHELLADKEVSFRDDNIDSRELMSLTKAYAKITDPDIRRTALNLVKSLAACTSKEPINDIE